MKIKNKLKYLIFLVALLPLITTIPNIFTNPKNVYAVQTAVNLLTTTNFAILAGSAISNVPTSSITGDVGLDPTGGASITGLTCAEMTGTSTIYDNNGGYAGGGGGSTLCRTTNAGKLTTAKTDLVTAYNDAAGRTTTSTIATELGGSTLTDGVYDSAAGTFGITGTLTLDGQGNANSVFIFKMTSTLITATNSRVVLTNGAQACNVFWQVGSSTTLGIGSTLIGNVLTLTTITANTGSTVYGRLLARNGAVTLDHTTVAIQNCAATGGSSSSSSSSSNNTSIAYCPPISNQAISPTIIESRRVSPTSIFISWGPYSGINTFNVRYGPTNGNWLYNTNVTGMSTTINDLPANQPMWFEIAVRNECQIGEYGPAKLVGGPMLPNTGFEP